MTNVDDEEEKLVQEVIAENPVEERGVRNEWIEKVGWHRKEVVRLGHPSKKTMPLSEQNNNPHPTYPGAVATDLRFGTSFWGIIIILTLISVAWRLWRTLKQKKQRSL
jgi:hypothetical protein